MKWSFRIATFFLGVVLLAGAVAVMRPRPLDVEVATAAVAPLEQTVVEEGRARVRERYTVSAPVEGTLARIELREGDAVEPGTVLARLLPLPTPLMDPRSRRVAEQRLASAIDSQRQSQAAVARAASAAEQADDDRARVARLAQSGAVSPVELETATSTRRVRAAELDSARFAESVAAHDAEQARAALERFAPGGRPSDDFTITSPIHGQVLHVLHKSEGTVTAGTDLLEIGDPQALELVAPLLSQDAVALRPGMAARVLHWGGEPALSARVRRVEPSAFTRTSALGVDEQRVNVLLDLDGPPDALRSLGDGFAAEVAIIVWSRPDALQVPTSSLFRRGEGWAVFAVHEGRATERAVQVGHSGPLESEIAGGLARDEVVVVHPSASVREGVRVQYR